jgi:hypothetical protein
MKGGKDPMSLRPNFRGAGIVEKRDVIVHREEHGFTAL